VYFLIVLTVDPIDGHQDDVFQHGKLSRK